MKFLSVFLVAILFPVASPTFADPDAGAAPKDIAPRADKPRAEVAHTLFPKPNTGRQVIALDSLSEDQRAFYWHGTRIDPKGFLSVEVSPEYVQMLSELNIDRDFKRVRGDDTVSVNGLALLGTMDEGKHKKSFAFGNRTGAGILVTAWRFKDDGASFTVVKEFLNQSVDGFPAILSLAVAEGVDKCMWKLFVAGPEVSYDVMIVDNMVAGKPMMSVPKVMEVGKKLVVFSNDRL